MNKSEINDLFDKFEPGDKKKDEIYKKVLESKSNKEMVDIEKRKNKRSINRRYRPVIAAVFILVFSVGVFASGYSYNNFSEDVIEISQSLEATSLGISTEDKGYRITAESMFGDNTTIYMLYSVEKENDNNFKIMSKNGKSVFGVGIENFDIQDEEESISVSYYPIDIVGNNDNKNYFLIRYSINADDIGENRLENRNLSVVFDKIGTGKLGFMKKGNWNLEIPLNNIKDLSRTKELSKEINYDGKKGVLDRIKYSKYDISIYFSSLEGAFENATENEFNEENTVRIKLKNGEFVKEAGSQAGGDMNGNSFYKNYKTIEIGGLDPNEIEAIIIGNEEIPVDLKY